MIYVPLQVSDIFLIPIVRDWYVDILHIWRKSIFERRDQDLSQTRARPDLCSITTESNKFMNFVKNHWKMQQWC